MKIKSTIFSILVFSFLPSKLVAETSIILKQEDSPVQIVEYKVDTYASSLDEGIETKLVLKNLSGSKIAVVRFGEVTFNSFGEYFDSSVGLISNSWKGILSGEIIKENFSNISPGIEFVTNYGTGFVFIDAVRFEDGKIWRANRDDIVVQIKEMFESFSGDMITETKKNKS